jgi:plastocyanin
MDRRTYLATVGATAAGLTVGLAGCEGAPGQGADEPETDEPTGTAEDESAETGTPTTGAGTQPTVEMVTDGDAYYFDPIGLFVELGATVTWRNVAGAHSTIAYVESADRAAVTRIPSGAEGWRSEVYSEEGATFQHSPDVEGTYDYFCGPHKTLGMIGRLVVGEPGGPAEEGQPPDGELPDSQTILDQGSVSYDEFVG